MSDILISFRPDHIKDVEQAVKLMKYFDSIQIKHFNFEDASIAVSRSDRVKIWGPYEDKNRGILVALSGRIALDSEAWSRIRIDQNGGIACNYICSKYIESGESCISELNGNYTVIIYDTLKDLLLIGTDRCGTVPCFKTTNCDFENLIISSHPDIIAALLGKNTDIDFLSCAEFLSTGKLTPPYTYYKNIEYLESGSIHSINGIHSNNIKFGKKKYFDLSYSFEHGLKENDLVEELAFAFNKAINRRTLPIFGKTGVSLSAGQDSRTVLCAIKDKSEISTFSFFDVENNELAIAKKIASAANVTIIPIRRSFEHYGATAIDGICISAGMSDFGNNHYLGFKETLCEHGIENILTGFYCDYMFKGLALNKKENKFTRRERILPFDYSWYMPVYWFNSEYCDGIKNRLEKLFPKSITNVDNEMNRSIIERNRVFPLCYEPDNIETIVPQRTMGWYLPIVDNDILEIYLKIPPSLKINSYFFSKVTAKICGNDISKIPNGNTGARIVAHPIEIMLTSNIQALKRKLILMKDSIGTFDSWPNWDHYIKNSPVIDDLWRKDSYTSEVINSLVGEDLLNWKPSDFLSSNKVRLFRRILTIKIWLNYNLSKNTVFKPYNEKVII